MSEFDAPPDAAGGAAPTLWDQYLEALASLARSVATGAPPHGAAQAAMPPLLPWQDLLQRLGMSPAAAAAFGSVAESGTPSQAPALGWTREYEEIVRRLLDLTQRFAGLHCEYVAAIGGVHHAATQTLQQRMATEAALSQAPAAAYDAWIDAAEAAYAQTAHSGEFAALVARMCNTLSDCRNERAKLLARAAQWWDLPSRSEVDGLHRQVKVLAAAARAAADTEAEQPRSQKPRSGTAKTRRSDQARKPPRRRSR